MNSTSNEGLSLITSFAERSDADLLLKYLRDCFDFEFSAEEACDGSVFIWADLRHIVPWSMGPEKSRVLDRLNLFAAGFVRGLEAGRP